MEHTPVFSGRSAEEGEEESGGDSEGLMWLSEGHRFMWSWMLLLFMKTPHGLHKSDFEINYLTKSGLFLLYMSNMKAGPSTAAQLCMVQ